MSLDSNSGLTRRAALVGAGAALGLASAAAGLDLSDIRPNQRLRVGADDRLYRLVAPKNRPKRGAALALALHGMGVDSISLMPLYSGLDDLARAHGFVLAYPASFENHWPLSFGPKLDRELAFFDALIADLAGRYGIDAQNIYLLGMSNGGYFAIVLASQRGRKLAGLCVHSGSAGVLALSGVKSPRKFPVFIAHGLADTILVPKNGADAAALFRREGHPTLHEEYEGLGHIWNTAANERIWAHWAAHPPPARPG